MSKIFLIAIDDVLVKDIEFPSSKAAMQIASDLKRKPEYATSHIEVITFALNSRGKEFVRNE